MKDQEGKPINVKNINLTPAELLAILEHKRTMINTIGREISLEEAIKHFIIHFRANWLNEKHRRDNTEQLQEIDRHKYFRSQSEGHDIGKSTAAAEWCEKYACIWRSERESLERNGFLKINVIVTSREGLHTRPASRLTEITQPFDCDVYLHRPGMEYFNFRLQGRPYLNVKSVIGLLSLDAVQGESLEFIASGPDARKALKKTADYIQSGFHLEHIQPGTIT